MVIISLRVCCCFKIVAKHAMLTCHQNSWVLGFMHKFLQLLVKTLFFLSLFFGVLMISANLAVSSHQLHGIVGCF